MNNNRIFFGVPIRNRAWCLPEYLEGLLFLDYDKKLIDVCFYLNDSIDNTYEILLDFKNKYNYLYNSISIINEYFNKPEDRRDINTISLFPHFANIKNNLKDIFLSSYCDYWLHVDSDSPCKPDTLKKLLRHDVGYICGVCRTSKIDPERTGVMKPSNSWFSFNELNKLSKNSKIEVFWVGGIALIRRDIALSCNYEVIDKYKDDNYGFCTNIRKIGEKAYIDPSVRLEHFLTKEMLYEYRNNIDK